MKRTWRRTTAMLTVVTVIANLVGTTFIVSPALADTVDGYNGHKVVVTPHYQGNVVFDGTTFACQSVRPNRPLCYSPQQIRNAYNIQPLLKGGFTGKGRTIVIVDAYSNPYVQSDLQIFDQIFGLPDPDFQIIAPFGTTPFDINDANQVGWSGEISLDVLWAHAIAPEARIVLALAKTNDDRDIYKVTKWAVDHGTGDVISQSFGEGESCADPRLLKEEHNLFRQATRKDITLVASSGDEGAAQPTCDGSAFYLSASTPASDPYVLAVGGTNLNADTTTGAYISERAWADDFSGCTPAEQFGCSGGGYSNIYDRPDYQNSIVNSKHRSVPDVAYNAGVDGGVLTHWGVGLATLGLSPTLTNTFFIFGGTSAGAPQWSGLIAIGDQIANRNLGHVNRVIYHDATSPLYNATLNDITSGNNNYDVIPGYNTSNGWDAVTGWGTPKADKLLPALVEQQDKHDDQTNY